MDVIEWMPHSRRMLHLFACSVTAWRAHRGASKGAALAFYLVLAGLPLLLALAAADLLYGAADGQLPARLLALVGRRGAQAAERGLAAAHGPPGGLGASSGALALVLFGATLAFAELKDSLDQIWGMATPRHAFWRELVRTRLFAGALIAVVGSLLLASLLASAALAWLAHEGGGLWRAAAALLAPLAALFGFLCAAMLFGLIFKMLPRVRLCWRDVTIGALGSALLFTLGKWVLGQYLAHASAQDGVGAGGTLIALLLWVYYSAQTVFLGAEFARQYALQVGSLRERPPACASGAKVIRLR
jgi:membrane protein